MDLIGYDLQHGIGPVLLMQHDCRPDGVAFRLDRIELLILCERYSDLGPIL